MASLYDVSGVELGEVSGIHNGFKWKAASATAIRFYIRAYRRAQVR
jgi:hypothetical protein